MPISILIEPDTVASNPRSPQWRTVCLKLPYVWALPYKYRDSMQFHILADVNSRVMQCETIIVTGPKGLAALEAMGMYIRNVPCGYDALLGASVKLAGGQRVIIAPVLKDMRTYGRTMRFLYVRSFDRIARPATFMRQPTFHHTHITSGQHEYYSGIFDSYLKPLAEGGAAFIAVDLETTKLITTEYNGLKRNWGACITVVGYSFVFWRNAQWYIESYTQEFASEADYRLASKVAACPLHKSMHNGQYDATYFTRWNMLLNHYTHDTQDWFKSVTPHLKKRSRGKETKGFYSLQAVSNLYLMDSTYWKDGRGTSGMEYFRYCAMDCHRTACITIAQLNFPRKQTMHNYTMSAYLRPVCQVGGLRGFRILEDERKKVKEDYLRSMRESEEWIKTATGYGSGQSKQLLPLLAAIGEWAKSEGIIGARTIKDTSKESMRDIADWHPIFAHLSARLREARQKSKWLSTYIMKPGWSAATHNGGWYDEYGRPQGGWGPEGQYFLYKLDPFGTDSRRLASSASNLWTGGNGQNIPGDLRVMYGGYPGCELGASDLSAAETRTTAYLSKCNTMREAVESVRDFHASNSEFFFGIPYELIYSDEFAASPDPVIQKKAVLDKEVRNLGKKINHAANYMMGVRVFIENAGIRVILKMQELLKLPVEWQPQDVVKFVLNRFDKRFPEVRNAWATEQAIEVLTTGRLQCVTGYAPLFLESPMHNKSVLNQCVATESQHLSAQIALRIFHNLWLAEQANPDMLYALLQIHDENMFGFPTGTDKAALDTIYLGAADAELPFNFNWRDGTQAVLRIPADKPLYGPRWYDVKG